MSVRVRFACGHGQAWAEGDAPVCATCGERRVARVQAPPPRFRGVVQGPSATAEDLTAVAVPVAPGGALTLQESPDGR